MSVSRASCSFLRATTRYARPSSSSSAAARPSRRSVHTVPGLKYPIDAGVGDFLSPAALKLLAVEYQAGLLSRLNDEVRDTELAAASVVTTVINTASDRKRVLAFNYASQALNNGFFLENLAPPPRSEKYLNHEDHLEAELSSHITREFGSLSQLKSNASSAALGMMSSGWIWLVMDQQKQLAIVPTYGAGTMLVRSRMQMTPQSGNFAVVGELSMRERIAKERAESATLGNPSVFGEDAEPAESESSEVDVIGRGPGSQDPSGLGSQSRSLHTSSSSSAPPPRRSAFPYANTTPLLSGPVMLNMGDKLSPLFCISVNEHAWLMDYGVWGKEEYLRRFWDALDWGNVSNNYHLFARTM